MVSSSDVDLTAGGNIGENARWQVDETVVDSQMKRSLNGLKNSVKATSLADFEFFSTFLQIHDENVVSVFKWILKQIKKKSSKSRADSESDFDHFDHSIYYYGASSDNLPAKPRYAFYFRILIIFINGMISFQGLHDLGLV